MNIDKRLVIQKHLKNTVVILLLNITVLSTLVIIGVLTKYQNREYIHYFNTSYLLQNDLEKIENALYSSSEMNHNDKLFVESSGLLLAYNPQYISTKTVYNQLYFFPSEYQDLNLLSTISVHPISSIPSLKALLDIYKTELSEFNIEQEGSVEGFPFAKGSFVTGKYEEKYILNIFLTAKKVDESLILSETIYPSGFDITKFSSKIATVLMTAQLVDTNTESTPIQTTLILEKNTTGRIPNGILLTETTEEKYENRSCIDLYTQKNSYSSISGKNYNFCYYYTDTYNHISDNGYVITSSYSATPHPIDTAVNYLFKSENQIEKIFWDDLVSDVKKQNTDISNLPIYDKLNLIDTIETFIYLIDKKLINIEITNSFNQETIISNSFSRIRNSYNILFKKPLNRSQHSYSIFKLDLKQETPFLSFCKTPITNLSNVNIVSPNSYNQRRLKTTNEKYEIDKEVSALQSNLVITDKGCIAGFLNNYTLNTSKTIHNSDEILKQIKNSGVKIDKKNKITEELESGVKNFNKGYFTYSEKELKNVVKSNPKNEKLLQPILNSIKKHKNMDKTPLFKTEKVETFLEYLHIDLTGNLVILLIISSVGFIVSCFSFLILTISRKNLINQLEKPSITGNPVLNTDKP